MAYRVLFVCMGNICRSPTAQGVMEHLLKKHNLAKRVVVDSAGTHNYHPNRPPDPRSQKYALQRGYDLSKQRARQVQDKDFELFDLIVAVDLNNLMELNAKCPSPQKSKLKSFASYLTEHQAVEVPDPYYGGNAGFEYVLDLVEDGCRGIISQHSLITQVGA